MTKRNKKYQANIWIEGNLIYLGVFNTPEEASEMHEFAKRQLKVYARIIIRNKGL